MAAVPSNLRSVGAILVGFAVACSGEVSPTIVSGSDGGIGHGSGGAAGEAGRAVSSSVGGNGPTATGGGAGGAAMGGGAGDAGSGGAGGSEVDAAHDAGADGAPDAGASKDAGVVVGADAGPPPTYEGEIPMYDGPPVGPEVMMNCPGDPTEGWTEYKDTFHVERPYDVPINTRFSIEGGIYNFWVRSNDKPHTRTTDATNPRTEAKWGGLFDAPTGGEFTTGMRMWSADMLLESSAEDSVIMQLHTTATGVGPVYLVLNGGSIAPIDGSSVPGGLVNAWFNLKVAFNSSTLQSQLYVNNCLKATITGPRGNGKFYFKNGVYHCSASVCRDHYKNIHLYRK
jgi:hypothetical protein